MNRLRNLLYESDSSEEEQFVVRRPRWIKERNNWFDDYDDEDFAMRFRLSKSSTLSVLAKIENNLEYISDR